ncbi:helix-turn-helix domain-containing protein [Bosea thiooxidans]
MSANAAISGHPMHEADILAAVRKSKYRFLPAIAAQYQVSDVSLRAAFRRPQLRAERVLSRALGIPLHVLWPDRWSPNGVRLVRRGRAISRAA